MWSHKTGSRRGQVVARPVLTVHAVSEAFDQLIAVFGGCSSSLYNLF